MAPACASSWHCRENAAWHTTDKTKGATRAMARTDLNLLGVFVALYTELNATRAAVSLGVTQSAVSHSLKTLRERFGDPLFERSARGLKPTQKAVEIAPRILEAVHAAEEVLGTRQRRYAPVPRALHLAMSDYGVALFLRSLADWLGGAHPLANLRVANLSRAEALAGLEDRMLDIAIGAFPGAVHARLRQHLLLEDPFVTVAWKGNAELAQGLTLTKFVELPHLLVTVSGDAWGLVDEHLERRGLRRRVALAVPSFLLAPELLIGTDMLLTVSSAALGLRTDLANELIVLQPPLALPPVEVVAVTHARSETDELVQQCCRALQARGRHALDAGPYGARPDAHELAD